MTSFTKPYITHPVCDFSLTETTNFKSDKMQHFTRGSECAVLVAPHNICIHLEMHSPLHLIKTSYTRVHAHARELLHHGVQTRGEKAALPGCAKEKEERAADSQLHSSSSHTQDPDARLH